MSKIQQNIINIFNTNSLKNVTTEEILPYFKNSHRCLSINLRELTRKGVLTCHVADCNLPQLDTFSLND